MVISLQDLNHLIGKNIQVNRKGPSSFKGELLDIQSDYIVLESDKGRTYVPTYHIKTIGFLSDQNSNEKNENEEKEEYNHPAKFADLVMSYKYHWVNIDGGPNKVEGIPIEISGDNLIVSSKKEVINVVLSHVKSLVYKPQNKQENQDNQNSNEKDQEKQEANNKKEEKVDRSAEVFEEYIKSRISNEPVTNRISDDDYKLKIFYSDRYGTLSSQSKQKTANAKKSSKSKRR